MARERKTYSDVRPVGTKTDLVEVTPALDTSAYASGDFMGDVWTITDAVREDSSFSVLQDVVVLDKDLQTLGMTIHLFNESPTIASADNAALDISDTEAEKYIGSVEVVAGDYSLVTASNSAANVKNIGLVLKGDSDGNVYGILESDGAPTHTASGLVLKFGLLQD